MLELAGRPCVTQLIGVDASRFMLGYAWADVCIWHISLSMQLQDCVNVCTLWQPTEILDQDRYIKGQNRYNTLMNTEWSGTTASSFTRERWGNSRQRHQAVASGSLPLYKKRRAHNTPPLILKGSCILEKTTPMGPTCFIPLVIRLNGEIPTTYVHSLCQCDSLHIMAIVYC